MALTTEVYFSEFGAWEVQDQVRVQLRSAGLVSSKASLLGLQVAAVLLPLLTDPVCADPGVSLCVQVSSSYRDTSRWIRVHTNGLILT